MNNGYLKINAIRPKIKAKRGITRNEGVRLPNRNPEIVLNMWLKLNN